MRYITAVLFCLALVQVTAAKEPIVFAAEDSWPPYSDKTGNGISKKLIQAALASSQFEVTFIAVPYARALELTEHGVVNGCFNVTRQADTEQRFLFGEQVLLTAQASYYFPSNKAQPYKSPVQIPDATRVGLIRGYEYGNAYEQHRHRFQELRVSTQEQLVSLLRAERIDVAIMFDKVAKHTLEAMTLPENSISKGELNHQSDIYVAFSRKLPISKRIIKALDEGLEKLKK